MLKAVIFDMDGVIINSEPQHYQAYVMVCQEYGIEFPYEEYKGFIGGTHQKVCEYVSYELKVPLSPEVIREKIRENIAYLIKTEGYEEIKGIKSLIQDLHRNHYKLAVASSSPQKEIQAVVDFLGIQDCFEKLISGESVTHPKPSPEIFEKAMKELGVTKDECVIIEDSSNGVNAGCSAGVPVLGFYNPDSGNQDLSRAVMVVEGFEEVDADFIKKVYQRAHKLP